MENANSRAESTARPVELVTADGFRLAASFFAAEAGAKGVLLVVPATGVKRSLYRPFAEAAARRGWGTLTWDWRGTGDSRPTSLRGFAATMRQWATLDLAAALAWAAGQQLPMVALGHSFGGQAIGLAAGAEKLQGLVTVAAQSGYWRFWPPSRQPFYAALWYLALPSLCALFGYYPARRLGLGEDLPKGVALEWARWCRHPEYLQEWEGHARLRMPLLAWSFADDRFAPPRAVSALHRYYSAAEQEQRAITPASYGLTELGHFGFFRRPAEKLWHETLDWLDAIPGLG